jgi:CRISPR-associated protein Csm1
MADVEKHMPKFFECIAQFAEGRPLLGYLKADADNLGQIFIKGLGINNTVSRIATLSRMLDVFFSGYMQKLMEDKYNELYTVYSGGDDVLVVGPWDRVINFAEELNIEFERFCSGNKNITISAGIGLVKHNYPVFRAVEIADNFLDASKDSGRNRITIFGHVITWKELPDVRTESTKLKQWLAGKNVSTGFARNLLYYAQMHQKYDKEKKTDYLRFLPLMTYDIARNLPSLDDKNAEKKAIRQWAEELKDLSNPKLHRLDIIANYALTANRGGKNE